LFSKNAKGPKGEAYAAHPNEHQDTSEESIGECETERPFIGITLSVAFSLVVGAFSGALLVAFNVNDERQILRSFLIGIGPASAELGGLPPQRLPAKWKPYATGQYQDDLPHGNIVTCPGTKPKSG
jgi:hypothetical protein